MPDLNLLIADHVEEARASDLDAEAERIQGDAGLSHRRVNVDDPPAAERLSAAFGLLGYTPERFVIMAHRRRPDRDVDTTSVQEVDWKLMRPAREREIASQPWAADPGLVQQLLAKHELTAEGTRTRYFAALRAAAGFGFVFLVTVAEDWPQHFYRRLGFEPVGIESRFLRIIDA